MFNKPHKILLLLSAISVIFSSTAICAEKDSKWEYGVKLLPLYVSYMQMPIDSSVEVLMPTPLPPPDDKMWVRTSKDSEFSDGIVGTWRYGGVYLKRKIPYRKYVDFAIEGSCEYYLQDDIVAHWGSSTERFDKHHIGSILVPKLIFYWEPVKYFSWGVGYGVVFMRTKTWFDNFNFAPLYYSGDKEVQTQHGVFLGSIAFNLPVSKNIIIGFDMVISLPQLPWPVRMDDGGDLYYVMTPGARLNTQVLKIGFY